MKKFYRARLGAEEAGLAIYFDTFVSVYETECYHFCVNEYAIKFRPCWIHATPSISAYRYYKSGYKITKIDKRGSRIGFKTKDAALENLRLRRERQIAHLKRELAFAEFFLSAELDDSPNLLDGSIGVKGSENLVNEYLRFE